MNDKLQNITSDVFSLMNDRDEIEGQLKKRIRILYNEIRSMSFNVEGASFDVFSEPLNRKTKYNYITYIGTDESDYCAHYSTCNFTDNLSIPKLYVQDGYDSYVVYFPDELLFKSVEEVEAFIDENNKKYNAIAEEKLKEKVNAEEYETYLKLKKKFE